ncbi:efflux transporter outer membrane subunit [Alcaligenaceae bacterium B3P038]|nr:efflux transporter outer membrane subunit [Alcaligenaceae bacterium B3P038]
MKFSFLFVGLLALGGCTLDPNYVRPESPVPAQWPTGDAYGDVGRQTAGAQAQDVALPVPWQQFVLEPKLSRVIDAALSNNRDLRRAAANIESARAQYRIERSDLFPTLSAGGDYTRSRTQIATGGDSTSIVGNSYSVSASLSAYELDFFGRVRSLSRAALEQYLATEEAARAARISVVAEVANAYILLATDRALLEVAQQTQASAEQTVKLIQARLSGGISSRNELRQAETIFQRARSDVANYRTLIAQDRNALQLLVGQPVDEDWLPASLSPETAMFAAVPAGMSSTVLLSRPDVAQAEHSLLAANANIGAARAAFFPRVSLTASGGFTSNELSGLFSSGNKAWSFAPSISIPIFDGGFNRANLAYARAQRDGLVADYELAVQAAFRDVADALARAGTIDEQVDAQRALYEASLESYGLSDALYRRGVGTFLDALDAQRTLYSAQQTYLSALQLALENRVALYRALGGGV